MKVPFLKGELMNVGGELADRLDLFLFSDVVSFKQWAIVFRARPMMRTDRKY
jgi:hypothetical protein